MRIVFMGTPDFSVPVLETLIEAGHEIAGVVTQPDKPRGRGKSVLMPPVKEKALERGLTVFQPLKVRALEFVEVLKDVSSGLAPLSYEEAYSMIHSLRAYNIIKGTRGQKGVNEDKFAEIIVRLSTLLRFATEIKELDLNPLLATEKQVIAVDARIRIEKT